MLSLFLISKPSSLKFTFTLFKYNKSELEKIEISLKLILNNFYLRSDKIVIGRIKKIRIIDFMIAI